MVVLAVLAVLASVAACAGVSGPAPAARIFGIYTQQTIETASVGGHLILLTRMTRFERCGGRRPLAEEVNDHTAEILGQQIRGIGFVAGIVNVTDGCAPRLPDPSWADHGR